MICGLSWSLFDILFVWVAVQTDLTWNLNEYVKNTKMPIIFLSPFDKTNLFYFCFFPFPLLPLLPKTTAPFLMLTSAPTVDFQFLNLIRSSQLQIPLLVVSMNYILVDIWYYYSSCKGAIMLYWISILDLHAKIIPINQQSLYAGLMQMIHTLSPVFVFKGGFQCSPCCAFAWLKTTPRCRLVSLSTNKWDISLWLYSCFIFSRKLENEKMHWFASLIITSQIWAGELATYERAEHSSSWKTAHEAESKKQQHTTAVIYCTQTECYWLWR